MFTNYTNTLCFSPAAGFKVTNSYSLNPPLHTVHNRAVVLLSSPLPKPHLRGRGCWMEVVNVIHGVWVRVITGTNSHVTAFLPVRADVFPQRRGLLEAAVAEGAAARSLSGVDELVVFEVLQAAQALPTDGAHVGFLPGVRAPVFAQTVQVAEAVSTLGARVWLLARVYAQVGFKRP